MSNIEYKNIKSIGMNVGAFPVPQDLQSCGLEYKDL